MGPEGTKIVMLYREVGLQVEMSGGGDAVTSREHNAQSCEHQLYGSKAFHGGRGIAPWGYSKGKGDYQSLMHDGINISREGLILQLKCRKTCSAMELTI